MNEEEWLACEDPHAMLMFLRNRLDDRHYWYFVAACLRRCLPALDSLPTDQEARRMKAFVELLDRIAGGTATPAELESHYPSDVLNQAWGEALAGSLNAAEAVVSGMLMTKRFANRTAERRVTAREAAITATRHAERAAQSALLRCIAGNPFGPVNFDVSWRTPNVVSIARATFAERRFANLPILADVLEEAGCADVAILNHCRGSDPHARGCWVIEGLTGQQ
jgi:hypothetical protein